MELLLIVVIAPIVLGPEKLPEVMAQVGKAINELRQVTTQSDEFNRTIQAKLNETRSVVEEAKATVSEARANVDEALTATLAPQRHEAPLAPPSLPTIDTTAPPALPTAPAADEAVSNTNGTARSAPKETRPWSWDTAPSPPAMLPAASSAHNQAASGTTNGGPEAQPVEAITRSRTASALTEDLLPPY